KTQSPFEREIMRALEDRGYRVTPQWRVGKYRIDLVVEGNGQRLAIECDGDPYYPVDIGKLPEDMERQAILERLGWIFTRIGATDFLRDADGAMRPVPKKLNLLEIPPQPPVPELQEENGRLLAQTNTVTGPRLVPVAENSEAEDPAPEDLVARVV